MFSPNAVVRNASGLVVRDAVVRSGLQRRGNRLVHRHWSCLHDPFILLDLQCSPRSRTQLWRESTLRVYFRSFLMRFDSLHGIWITRFHSFLSYRKSICQTSMQEAANHQRCILRQQSNVDLMIVSKSLKSFLISMMTQSISIKTDKRGECTRS